MNRLTLAVAAFSSACAISANAQSTMTGKVEQLSAHMGEMMVEVDDPLKQVDDRLQFEPYQMLDEVFSRGDLVFLMRHGPTDWSKLDEKNVAPSDCDNQRVLNEAGKTDMQNLGVLLGANNLFPSQIIVSEWCRNQQTLENLQIGFDNVLGGMSAEIPTRTDASLNLLLSLQGAPDVQEMREVISAWDGSGSSNPLLRGPLLMISHFTNIEELTNFTVFEGEMLVIDPKRDNRVVGYLRLKSAAPDIGHFNPQ